MGIDWMFLDFCNDESTALNSKAPTRLGRMGVCVGLRAPNGGRLTRMLFDISPIQRSRSSSFSSASMVSPPPRSSALKSSIETPRDGVLELAGAASSSSKYCGTSSSSPPGVT